MLAEKMREQALSIVDNDRVEKSWNWVLGKIDKASKNGQFECAFQLGDTKKHGRDLLKSIITNRLEAEHFKVVKGKDIGKDIYDADTLFITW